MQLVFSWNGNKNRILVAGANNQNPKSTITDTKFYVSVLTQKNIKLLKKLESGFKIAINWNKYLAKTTNQAQIRYLDFLIDLGFQGVNRLFVLSFKDDNGRESHKQYYLRTVEIKDYNVMIEEISLISQLKMI